MSSTQAIQATLNKQREFFRKHSTRSYEFRKSQLLKLETALRANEPAILEALFLDLHKSEAEAYLGEIAVSYDEIRFALKHLKEWMKPEKVSTPLTQIPGQSFIHKEPLGSVLIIGPWNYPFQLLMAPLIGALAAGNCVVLKPSELAPYTSKVVARILIDTFPEELVFVFEGAVETSQLLLKEKWDHIFFTGGTAVGKVVMRAAAEHLTPVTLELGGKSPCIVDNLTDMEVTARRIAWGKYFNAGQTCVAPDYLLVRPEMKELLVGKICNAIEAFYGADPQKSQDYGRIISERHYKRLTGLLAQGRIWYGGKTKDSERYLSPTLVTDVAWESPLMQEEIFGPILPVVEYQNLEEAIALVNSRPKPLALYFFSSNTQNQDQVLAQTSFGGGCINDTLVHLANPRLPFGGVGDSGMGAYHGKNSFDTFTHRKSILRRSFWMDVNLRYPPYGAKLKRLKQLMK